MKMSMKNNMFHRNEDTVALFGRDENGYPLLAGFDENLVRHDNQEQERRIYEKYEREGREARENRAQKERVQIERVAVKGGNQIKYALDEINKRAILGRGTARASCYDLGFEDTSNGFGEAIQLLTLLRDKGYIQQYSQLSDDSFKLDGVKKSKIEAMKLELEGKQNTEAVTTKNEICLKSISLITESIILKDKIFLVLDELYQTPIRYAVKNNSNRDTAIVKLYDLAYPVNAPGKSVPYSKKTYDSIDKTVFGRRKVQDYMRTNKFKKPTIIQKSEDGKTLVLKGGIIKRELIKEIPQQYRYLYIDKTK